MPPSKVFVEAALKRAADAGNVASNMDVTLLIERPKIKPFKQQMVESLRKLVGPSVTINIKAGTNEGCGEIGRGRSGCFLCCCIARGAAIMNRSVQGMTA